MGNMNMMRKRKEKKGRKVAKGGRMSSRHANALKAHQHHSPDKNPDKKPGELQSPELRGN